MDSKAGSHGLQPMSSCAWLAEKLDLASLGLLQACRTLTLQHA